MRTEFLRHAATIRQVQIPDRIMKRCAALVVLLCLIPVGAWAHTDAYFDSHPGPHHGRMRMAGPYHLELVAVKDEITLYVTDHGGNPVDITGGSSKVIITSGKKKRYVVVLSAAGDNMLKGQGEFKLSNSSTASVLVALPGQEPQRAKFPLSATGKPAKKRHH
jgi:hypothetical protein